MIHYHGTPLTPREEFLTLRGKHFCVSYDDARDVALCHEIGQSVMIDNGAFTMWKQNKTPDWESFYTWVLPWLDYWTTWVVIPDVIDGAEEDNDALVAAWPYGDRGVPVFHMHESLGRLDTLVREWPWVAIGSSGEYATLGTDAWHRRMGEIMDVACDERGVPRTKLHMLRAMNIAITGPYPFYSADSATIAKSHRGGGRNGARKDVVRMATEIDSQQPPAIWVPPLEQTGLF